MTCGKLWLRVGESDLWNKAYVEAWGGASMDTILHREQRTRQYDSEESVKAYSFPPICSHYFDRTLWA